MARKRNFTKGALIGIALGAIGGLLLAPRSGKDTQKLLKSKASKLGGDAFEKVRETEAQVVERIETFKEVASDLRGEAYEESQKLIIRGEMIKHDLQEAAERLATNSKELGNDVREDVKGLLKDGSVFVKDIERSTKRIITSTKENIKKDSEK